MSTPAEYVQPGIAGYNIYRGLTSGNPLGEARSGLSAANLYGKLSGNSALNTGATGALDALGVYSGLQQGGWQGDTRAGASGLQLAGLASGDTALSTAGGAALIPLDAYDEVKNWQSGGTGSDALAGAQTGAAIGSVVPVVGTAIGALGGAAVGALSSLLGPGEKDPETADVQNVINATSANQNNPNVAASAQDPYLELAGLMDDRSSTLPEYQQYGRMGEQSFTDALTQHINNAVEADPTMASWTPEEVYNNVVSPWVNAMGSGYSNVGSTYAATNQGLLEDMTSQYMSGDAAQDWKAVGGDSPFSNIYANSPFQAAATPATANPAASGATAPRLTQPAPGTMMAKSGGSVQNPELRARIKKLYEGSFADRPRHFDDGGGVGYYSSSAPAVDPSAFNFYVPPPATAPASGLQGAGTPAEGVPIDIGSPSGQPSAYGTGNYSNSPSSSDSNTYYGTNGGGSSVLGAGGALSGLGSALGVSSMGQLVQQYGALAPLIAAALGGNKSASAPATPAGYGAIPSIATPTSQRSYTQPNVANWYTYGEGPEQSFFSNNQLPTIPGVSPASASPAPSPAPSAQPPMSGAPGVPQSNIQPIPQGPRPVMAAGGTFDSTAGDDYVPDPGHGDGTSDDIDAKLSGGEYVMDAGTVSMLGNGSNEAGSRALDQLRSRIRKHAGKQLVKGKQFMKAKTPAAYLKGSP
jgi:hypothetical protein